MDASSSAGGVPKCAKVPQVGNDNGRKYSLESASTLHASAQPSAGSKLVQESQALLLQKVRDRAHGTHSVKGNSEYSWCSKCGCVATLSSDMRLYKLAKPCEHIKARGKQNLAALEKGGKPFQKK